MARQKYKLTISRNTIDKLGVKLYDKASDVVSELISNSYDADAKEVRVTIPMGEFLATRTGGEVKSKNLKIIVEDDGHGFSASQANDFYLTIGNDRRQDPARGDKSPERGRPVMGRKGIGKLAAFGICKTIEVWSAAGKKDQESCRVSHFILRYDDITKDTDKAYYPARGEEDGKTSSKRGTKITLSDFLYKKIPDGKTFRRQIARKFGMESADFKIFVTDSVTGDTQEVSELDIELMEGTKIEVDRRPVKLGRRRLPVKGWIAYAKDPYANEEVAGVRIYARKKLAATSRDFGRKSGFTGEFTIRSYMVGKIHAEWLDEKEDLIASDRQDILWSSERGQALQEWGVELIEELGRVSRAPLKKKTFEEFKEKSNLESRAKQRFGDTPIYKAAIDVGKRLSGGFSRQNLRSADYVKAMLELVLSIAPHKTIVDKLKQIADEGDKNALNVMATIFGDTKLAEIASLGQVAEERIRAIDELEKNLRPRTPVQEQVMQELLENAPWLIDPQWTVLQANQTLKNFRQSFEDTHEQRTGEKITTTAIEGDAHRPDFIMLSIGTQIEIVEIKRPGHHLKADEYKRFFGYVEEIEEFRKENKEHEGEFKKVHATLVCDHVDLTGTDKSSYEGELRKDKIQRKTWRDMLDRAKKAHNDFLEARDAIFRESSGTHQ